MRFSTLPAIALVLATPVASQAAPNKPTAVASATAPAPASTTATAPAPATVPVPSYEFEAKIKPTGEQIAAICLAKIPADALSGRPTMPERFLQLSATNDVPKLAATDQFFVYTPTVVGVTDKFIYAGTIVGGKLNITFTTDPDKTIPRLRVVQEEVNKLYAADHAKVLALAPQQPAVQVGTGADNSSGIKGQMKQVGKALSSLLGKKRTVGDFEIKDSTPSEKVFERLITKFMKIIINGAPIEIPATKLVPEPVAAPAKPAAKGKPRLRPTGARP